jgi:hypothetical protein
VDRIFRNSDLAERLSLTLGPNFLPSYKWESVEGAADESEFGYRVYKKTLCVIYCPFGVSKPQNRQGLRWQPNGPSTPSRRPMPFSGWRVTSTDHVCGPFRPPNASACPSSETPWPRFGPAA